jgi:hypothetical protein
MRRIDQADAIGERQLDDSTGVIQMALQPVYKYHAIQAVQVKSLTAFPSERL